VESIDGKIIIQDRIGERGQVEMVTMNCGHNTALLLDRYMEKRAAGLLLNQHNSLVGKVLLSGSIFGAQIGLRVRLGLDPYWIKRKCTSHPLSHILICDATLPFRQP
jgi:hypothetical protein